MWSVRVAMAKQLWLLSHAKATRESQRLALVDGKRYCLMCVDRL